VTNLCVIVPSRGRPKNVERLIKGWYDTRANAHLLIALDDDDPEMGAYQRVLRSNVKPFLGVIVEPRRGLGPRLNHVAVSQAQRWTHLGFMGDDHLPRTNFWDVQAQSELCDMRSSIAYGNDLFQGPRLPTAVFMTSDIVRTLGYMCPPELIHMYLDNAWLAWGKSIDRIRYLPDVIIEHLHPVAGKSEVDSRYEEVWPLMGSDKERWDDYCSATGQFAIDRAKLRQLLRN
jgi:hypothetical protein